MLIYILEQNVRNFDMKIKRMFWIASFSSSYIVKEYKIRPIIWDDMLRDVFKSDIESYGLGKPAFI